MFFLTATFKERPPHSGEIVLEFLCIVDICELY